MAAMHKLIILTFLSITIVVTGCSKKSAAEQKEISATPAEKQKAELLKSLDRRFENAEAHYKLGQLYQNDGLWAQAQYEYQLAISFDPACRRAQAAMISVLLGMGDKAKADMTAETYIGDVSGSGEESLKLALAFQKERLDDLALRCYQQAIRLAPNSAKVNRQIGYYYLSKGDKSRAADYLHRSFQLNPNQPEVAGELGRLGVDITGMRAGSGRELDKIVTEADKARQK